MPRTSHSSVARGIVGAGFAAPSRRRWLERVLGSFWGGALEPVERREGWEERDERDGREDKGEGEREEDGEEE